MKTDGVCRWPKMLQKGDCVGLCAPSGAVSRDALIGAVQALEGFGLRVMVGESCLRRHGYLAGEDTVRAADVNRFAVDNDIKGIFAVRGGFGAQKILPLLDWEAIRCGGKPFVGYSDATAIHLAIQQRCGLVSYHAPMPATELRFGMDGFSRVSYERCLFEDMTGEICNPKGSRLAALSEGICEGVLTGGNLAILASSLGTPYALDARGKVLFIEEIGEAPYRVDRMLTQLALAGAFEGCVGVLLGRFTDCEAREADAVLKGFALDAVLAECFSGMGKPVVCGIACGHGLPSLSLPMGARLRVAASKNLCEIEVLR